MSGLGTNDKACGNLEARVPSVIEIQCRLLKVYENVGNIRIFEILVANSSRCKDIRRRELVWDRNGWDSRIASSVRVAKRWAR